MCICKRAHRCVCVYMDMSLHRCGRAAGAVNLPGECASDLCSGLYSSCLLENDQTGATGE